MVIVGGFVLSRGGIVTKRCWEGGGDFGDGRCYRLLHLNEPVVKADVLGGGLVDGNGEEGLAGERSINRTAILIFNIEDLVVGVGNRG